jgi:pyridine nucleotide-disulfide oxidoreductase
MASDVEVAVIGAGPHGVSAAVHLQREGIRARVFGEPMSFWRAMPRGMKLRSNMRATNLIEPQGPLSIAGYEDATGQRLEPPVPLERFVEYAQWVARTAVTELDDRQVSRLERAGKAFRLTLGDGEVLGARRVVVAAGIAPFARTPRGFEHLPPDRVSHTSEHREFARFGGRTVAVVGGGQSALESAALMSEARASVEVLVRAQRVVWLRGHAVIHRLGRLGPIVYAPTDVGPLWYSRLVSVPDLFRRLPRSAQDRIASRSIRPACSHFVRVRLNGTRLTTSVTVTRAEPDGDGVLLHLSDGSRRGVDHLMFGTGYAVDFRAYPFLDPEILGGVELAGGYPVLGRGLETSISGLHVAGAPAAWSFGPIMRFVSGSWYAGRAIARRIAG